MLLLRGEDQEKFVKVISLKEAQKNDYNLSPSRYLNLADEESYRDIPDILKDLSTLKVASNKIDQEMHKVLSAVPLK